MQLIPGYMATEGEIFERGCRLSIGTVWIIEGASWHGVLVQNKLEEIMAQSAAGLIRKICTNITMDSYSLEQPVL